MAPSTKVVRVHRSVVERIELDPAPWNGALVIDGRDVAASGQTILTHHIVRGPARLPFDVAEAIERIRRYAQEEVDRA